MIHGKLLGSFKSAPVMGPTHTASDATSTFPIFQAPFDCTIVAVRAIYQTLVTGADTNTHHINIDTRTSAGATAVEIASRDHVNGEDAAANEVHTFTNTGTAAQLNLDEDAFVFVEYEEIGNGGAVVFTNTWFTVEYRAR